MTKLESIEVILVVEKLVGTRVMWIGYLERRHVSYVVRKVDQMEGS